MTTYHPSRRLTLASLMLILAILLSSCTGSKQATVGWAGVTVDGDSFYLAFRGQVHAFTDGDTPITFGDGAATDPAWSHDGTQQTYAQMVGEHYQLFIRPQHGDAVQITDDPTDHRQPAFSPDGTQLVYVSEGDLFILDLPATDTTTTEEDTEAQDSPAALRLTDTPATEASPVWSPDGNYIAYTSDAEASLDIYTITPDGTETTRLTDDPADDISPTWSPDGNILFTSNRTGHYNLYLIDPDPYTDNLTRITQNDIDAMSPCRQPGEAGAEEGWILYQADDKDITRIYKIRTGQSITSDIPLWSYPDDDAVNNKLQFYAPPAIAGDRLYVGSYDRRVYALSITDGQPILTDTLDDDGNPVPWITAPLQDIIVDSVAVGEDMIYVPVANHNVIAFRTDTPQPEKAWTFKTDHGVWATPLLLDGTLYITSLDHHVYAVDAESGTEIWQSEDLTGAVPGRATYDATRGLLYVGTLNSQLYALDITNGATVHTYDTEDWVWSGPVLADDTLYFADMDGWLYAMPIDTWGTMHWKTRVTEKGGIRAAPLVTDEMIYVVATDGYLRARSRQDGTNIWRVPRDEDRAKEWGQILSPPVYMKGLILVSPMNTDTNLVAYDAEDGSKVWEISPLSDKD